MSVHLLTGASIIASSLSHSITFASWNIRKSRAIKPPENVVTKFKQDIKASAYFFQEVTRSDGDLSMPINDLVVKLGSNDWDDACDTYTSRKFQNKNTNKKTEWEMCIVYNTKEVKLLDKDSMDHHQQFDRNALYFPGRGTPNVQWILMDQDKNNPNIYIVLSVHFRASLQGYIDTIKEYKNKAPENAQKQRDLDEAKKQLRIAKEKREKSTKEVITWVKKYAQGFELLAKLANKCANDDAAACAGLKNKMSLIQYRKPFLQNWYNDHRTTDPSFPSRISFLIVGDLNGMYKFFIYVHIYQSQRKSAQITSSIFLFYVFTLKPAIE